jgi:hypothetical protein
MQMSPGQSCPFHPFSMESGGTEINTWVQGTLAPEDVVRREVRRVYSERLRSRRQRRWVEVDPEFMCPWVIDAERPPLSTSRSVNRNIMHPFQFSLKGKGKESLLAHP